MRPSVVFHQHRDLIRQMVLESGMANPRLFGSALHGDDLEGSDLDILVDPTSDTSLLDIAKLKLLLQTSLEISVDLRTPKFLHESIRSKVLQEALPV